VATPTSGTLAIRRSQLFQSVQNRSALRLKSATVIQGPHEHLAVDDCGTFAASLFAASLNEGRICAPMNRDGANSAKRIGNGLGWGSLATSGNVARRRSGFRKRGRTCGRGHSFEASVVRSGGECQRPGCLRGLHRQVPEDDVPENIAAAAIATDPVQSVSCAAGLRAESKENSNVKDL